MSSKQDTIANVYYDRSGFGSLKTTLEDSRKKDPSIKIEDVKQFFAKNVEVKKKARGENSFIPPSPFYEYQLDLFFISKDDIYRKLPEVSGRNGIN